MLQLDESTILFQTWRGIVRLTIVNRAFADAGSVFARDRFAAGVNCLWTCDGIVRHSMSHLSSIALRTAAGDEIVLAASGFKVDPLRVLLMCEVDYLLMMRSIAAGGQIECRSHAMPILSSEQPKVKLRMPDAGEWRIVYQTEDADSVTAVVIPKNE